MNKSTARSSVWRYPFWIALLVTFLVYLLRGLGILTFLPGGIILGLAAFAIAIGIIYGIDKTRRF